MIWSLCHRFLKETKITVIRFGILLLLYPVQDVIWENIAKIIFQGLLHNNRKFLTQKCVQIIFCTLLPFCAINFPYKHFVPSANARFSESEISTNLHIITKVIQAIPFSKLNLAELPSTYVMVVTIRRIG